MLQRKEERKKQKNNLKILLHKFYKKYFMINLK